MDLNFYRRDVTLTGAYKKLCHREGGGGTECITDKRLSTREEIQSEIKKVSFGRGNGPALSSYLSFYLWKIEKALLFQNFNIYVTGFQLLYVASGKPLKVKG